MTFVDSDDDPNTPPPARTPIAEGAIAVPSNTNAEASQTSGHLTGTILGTPHPPGYLATHNPPQPSGHPAAVGTLGPQPVHPTTLNTPQPPGHFAVINNHAEPMTSIGTSQPYNEQITTTAPQPDATINVLPPTEPLESLDAVAVPETPHHFVSITAPRPTEWLPAPRNPPSPRHIAIINASRIMEQSTNNATHGSTESVAPREPQTTEHSAVDDRPQLPPRFSTSAHPMSTSAVSPAPPVTPMQRVSENRAARGNSNP